MASGSMSIRAAASGLKFPPCSELRFSIIVSISRVRSVGVSIHANNSQ
jgi:hypothetical protein